MWKTSDDRTVVRKVGQLFLNSLYSLLFLSTLSAKSFCHKSGLDGYRIFASELIMVTKVLR